MYYEICSKAYYPECFQAWAGRIVRDHLKNHPEQQIVNAFMLDERDTVMIKIYVANQSAPIVYTIIKSHNSQPHHLVGDTMIITTTTSISAATTVPETGAGVEQRQSYKDNHPMHFRKKKFKDNLLNQRKYTVL